MVTAGSAKNKEGFTLVELFLSLAIMAALMAAIAAAMQASFQSYSENEKLATAAQAARSALRRITDDIRTADAVEASGSGVRIIPPAGSGVDLIEYEATDNGKLYYRRTVNGIPTEHILLGDDGELSVESFYVATEMVQDEQDQWYTVRANIRLDLSVGGRHVAISASAAPRRNQEY